MVTVFIQLAPWYHPYEVKQLRDGEPIDKNRFQTGDWVIIKDDLVSSL